MNEPELSPLMILVNWLPFLVFLASIIYFARAFAHYTRERLRSQAAILASLDRIATAALVQEVVVVRRPAAVEIGNAKVPILVAEGDVIAHIEG